MSPTWWAPWIILGPALVAVVGAVVVFLVSMRGKGGWDRRIADADAEVAALGARIRAAGEPAELATLLIVLPVATRASQEVDVRGAPSGQALALSAIERLRAKEQPRFAALWTRVPPSSEAPAEVASLAGAALDTLCARDRSTEPTGFRHGAQPLSTPRGHHAVLAIVLVARGLNEAPAFDDPDGLLRALELAVPFGAIEMLHHAARWLPEDTTMGFDDDTVRRVFPELRAV